MKKIVKRIEKAVYDDGQTSVFSFEALLKTVSHAYGKVTGIRRALYRRGAIKAKQLPCIVISVGNITVGGTGKTPFTIMLAQELKQAGFFPAVVSRGYKGSASGNGGIVSDGRTRLMTPAMAGDEPYMIACALEKDRIPVVIGKSRYRAGMIAVNAFNADVVILDDGFQHLKLKRDIDIVLLDSQSPFGNGHLMPRGSLRESPESIRRADICVLTRWDRAAHQSKTVLLECIKTMGIPCFTMIHKPVYTRYDSTGNAEKFPVDTLKRKKVFVFSGIANNNDFIKTVKKCMCIITGHRFFCDHHQYAKEELDEINYSALSDSADLILTTRKDYVKLSWYTKWNTDVGIIDVDMVFNDESDRFHQLLKGLLNKHE